jgi:signal transduction histidine kinase
MMKGDAGPGSNVVVLTEFGPGPHASRVATGASLIGLGLSTWGVVSSAGPGFGAPKAAGVVLLVLAVAAWIGWRAFLWAGRSPLVVVCLAVLSVTGGALGSLSAPAIVFIGVAALGATLLWRIQDAAWIVVAGPAALLLSTPGAGTKVGVVVGGVAAALAGAVLGVSRRDTLESTRRAAAIEVTSARAEAEQARAELLAGRNHLARELHDVLAHTLSALSLQLEALRSMLSEDERPEIRTQLEASQRLVRESLDEARGAVLALREDAVPLEDQLAGLAAGSQVTFQVEGPARPLSPDVSLTLFRVTREALTNVIKHAPGATATVTLDYGVADVTVSIENGPGDGAPSSLSLADAGAGYGLQGIRERVLLLGGSVEAGPQGSRWRVEARVPA